MGKFLETVDQLTEWEDRHDAKDTVKTVSRMVQSFERTAIRSAATLVSAGQYPSYKAAVQQAFSIEEDEGSVELAVGSSRIETTACSMRRDADVFDLFAAAVAAEIVWADATNGTRSMPNHLCQRLLDKKKEAVLNLVRTIYAKRLVFNTDVVGMPLMDMTGSMCVARGVLVVCPSCQSATYVLDIEQPHGAPPGAPLDLSKVRTITITQVMQDEAVPRPPP